MVEIKCNASPSTPKKKKKGKPEGSRRKTNKGTEEMGQIEKKQQND